MGAHIEHEFSRGFVLDEERLRKLTHLISGRVDTEQKGLCEFQVVRADAFSYNTRNVTDVLSEDNSDWRRIKKLVINCEREESPEIRLMLTFGSPQYFEPATFNLVIDGDDRDSVFVLFSDVRAYIDDEVSSAFITTGFGLQLLTIPFFVLALFLISMFLDMRVHSAVSRGSLAAVLRSSDVNVKLNYLISQPLVTTESRIVFTLVIVTLAMAFLFVLVVGLPHRLVRLIWPFNEFLFGARRSRFERRRRLLANVFWVVVVGGVVSAAAGLVVSRIRQ